MERSLGADLMSAVWDIELDRARSQNKMQQVLADAARCRQQLLKQRADSQQTDEVLLSNGFVGTEWAEFSTVVSASVEASFASGVSSGSVAIAKSACSCNTICANCGGLPSAKDR